MLNKTKQVLHLNFIYIINKMAGKGKVGRNAKAGGAKRHDKKQKAPGRTELTLGGIRRLARRGGVKRISAGVYDETRDFVNYFLNLVVKDATVFTESNKRKTITAMDVIYALKRSGRTLYGYGVWWFSAHLNLKFLNCNMVNNFATLIIIKILITLWVPFDTIISSSLAKSIIYDEYRFH